MAALSRVKVCVHAGVGWGFGAVRWRKWMGKGLISLLTLVCTCTSVSVADSARISDRLFHLLVNSNKLINQSTDQSAKHLDPFYVSAPCRNFRSVGLNNIQNWIHTCIYTDNSIDYTIAR